MIIRYLLFLTDQSKDEACNVIPRRSKSDFRISLLFVFPALLQHECGRFGLSVSGEYALLVAVDTHDAFGRLEVRKVPCQLTRDEVIGIKYAEVYFIFFWFRYSL